MGNLLGLCIKEIFNSGWSNLENEVADECVRRNVKKTCLRDSCCMHPYWTKRMHVVRFLFFFGILFFMVITASITFWAVKLSDEPTDKYDSGDDEEKKVEIHVIIWPAVFGLLSFAMTVFISCTCGCKYTCKTEPPHEVKVMAARLHQLGVYTLMQLNPEERQRVLRECAPAPEPEEEHNAEVV